MPVQIETARNERIVILHYAEPLDVEEVIPAIQKVRSEVYDRAIRPVFGINDFSGIKRVPGDLLSQATRYFKSPHPMEGEVSVVVSNPFMNALIGVYNRVSRNKVTVFNSMDEALAHFDALLASEQGESCSS